MLILAVDTSTRSRSLAILQDNRVLAEVHDTEESPYSERFFHDLGELQALHSFQIREIDLFAVAAGPGSFTGLRVGLTAVKGWAEVHRKPIAAVSALDAVAIQTRDEEANLAAFIDARRGHVFGAIYRREQQGLGRIERIGEEVLVPATEFLSLASKACGAGLTLLVSPTPEAISAAVTDSGLSGTQVERVSGALAPFIGTLGCLKALKGELVDSLTLDANYVRRPDAELYLKSV